MIRILCVDDEAAVLEAMRRSMRSMRNEWSIEFVSSGAAALDALAKQPAEVIVSDMRMPGMDGWELLAKAKSLYPETVRLVLSGYAEPGAIMRLVGIAHQYLSKPGETETLKAAIAQTQAVRALLNSKELGVLVGSVGTLPTWPQSVQDISNCLRRPNASIGDAAAIITRDVAMTANIMKLVNSAFFGARRSITTVDRAVAYLGLDTLATLVLGHSLFQSSAATVLDSGSMERLWQHSQQTAMAARAIAVHEKLPRTRIEEAFLTGMLHDLGKLFADEQHAAAGGYLLGLWGFPSPIVEAIALHHKPLQRVDRGLDLTVLVHVADRLVNAQAPTVTTPEALGIEPGLLEGLGLLDHLPHWIATISAAGAAPPA